MKKLILIIFIFISSHCSFDDKSGIWKKIIGSEIRGSTIGIVGGGRIGTRVVEILQSFYHYLIILNQQKMEGYPVLFIRRSIVLIWIIGI